MDAFIIIMLGACGLVIWLLHVIRNKFDKTPDFLVVEEDETDYEYNNSEPSYTKQDEEIEALFEIVEGHINNGDRVSADANIEVFEEIIQKYPNKSYAYTQYAKALSLQTKDEFENNAINANRDKILELIHKAVDIDPKKSDVYSVWSNILYGMALQQDMELVQKGLLLDAIAKCEKAIELKPDNDLLYSNYADILEELYYITEDKDLITKCDDLYEKAVQSKPQSYNYSLWADLKTRFADSIDSSDLYLKALDLYDIALQKNQQELSKSLSDISENNDTSRLGKALNDLNESMHEMNLYDRARILSCKINALEKYGLMTDDVHSFETALELCDALFTVFLEVAPDKDMTREQQIVIALKLEIASRKGTIKTVASELETELIEIINRKDNNYSAFRLMMILKSLTGEVKEAFDWFMKLIRKVEDLEDLNWEYFEKDIKLTNLINSEEYIQYKSLHYKEEEIEDYDEEITSTGTDNQPINITAEVVPDQSLPTEASDLKKQADSLSIRAAEKQDIVLFENAIQIYNSAKAIADSTDNMQLSSACELCIADNMISISKIKGAFVEAGTDIETRLIKLLSTHYEDVCICMVRLKSLAGNVGEAMEWLDRLRKGSLNNALDWKYFEEHEDFSHLVQSYNYRGYKEIHYK